MNRFFFILILLLGANIHSFATHIVGGDLTYVCLGGGVYRFRLEVFRDCSNSTVGFDPNVTIAIYTLSSHSLYAYVSSNLSSETDVSLVSGANCTSPTLQCVKKGVYIFDQYLDNDPAGYYAVWQRCCRNGAIVNLNSPLTTGITYYTEIRNPGLCNSSPRFYLDPIPYICMSDTVSMNFNAIDPDGDVLEFSFTTPFTGGSSAFPMPTPPNPGPYSGVSWASGYGASTAFGTSGGAFISINSVNGELKMHPKNPGVYVVGVQVKEYRASQLIGVIRRDFQIIVGNCPPNAPPTINLPSTVVGGDLHFTAGINACHTITLTDANSTDIITMSGSSVILSSPYTATFPTVSGNGTVSSNLCWTPSCNDVKSTPYIFVISASDNGCPLPKLTSKTINVYVDPMPTLLPPTLTCAGTSSNHVVLNWTPNASNNPVFVQEYIIYRSVNGGPYAYYATTSATTFTDIAVTTVDNTYCYKVSVKNKCNTEGSLSNEVCSFPQLSPNLLCNLTILSTNQIQINWTNPISNTATWQFVIERSFNGGPYVTLTTLPNTTTSYIDNTAINAASNSYCYRIKILNTCQVTASAYSVDVCTRPPTPEVRVATVTATGTTTGANQIEWVQPNFNGAITQYELYHRPNNTGPWNLIATFSSALSGTMTYTHNSINTQNQTNAYLVRTYDNCAKTSDDSPTHETINLSTSTPAIKTVQLDWTPYQGWNNGVLRYVILRKIAASTTFTPIDSVPGNILTYTDINVSCSQTYVYKILARENAGNYQNSYSDEELATPYDNTPISPAFLRSVSVSKTDITNGEITIRLNASTDYRRKAYRVYRGENASTPVYVGDYVNSGTGVLTFTDTGLNTKNNTYTYYITVIDSCNNPESVPTTSHTTMNLTATGSLGAIILNWTPYVGFPILDKYIVERSRDGINYSEVDTLPANVTSTTDTVSCTPYYYRIRATELGGNAEFSYSDTSGARAVDPIPPQINFLRRVTVLTTSSTNGSVQLDWDFSPANDVKQYLIYRKESTSSTYSLVGFTNGTTKTYTDFGLDTRNLTYDYKMQVLDSCDNVSIDFTTTHTTINVTAISGEEKNFISWTPYGGWPVDKYQLFRNGALIKDFTASEFSYVDTTVTCKKKYDYQIKAIELGGLNEISYSDTSSAIPYKLRLPESKYLARVTVQQDKAVLIEWLKTQEKGTVKYRIYKKQNNSISAWQLIHTTTSTNDTTYLDLDVEVDKFSYAYKVTVLDECDNESTYSNEAHTILLTGFVPKPFQNQLNWTEYQEWQGKVSKYEVYRRVPSGNYSTIPIFTGTSLDFAYLDDQLIDSDGAFYVYKIVAYEGAGGLNQISESNEITLVQEPTLFVPTAFTPNNDGQNDVFDIKGVYICEFNLQIFDRWGNVIFSSNSLENKWNGTIKGETSPVTVFAYIIKVKSCTGKDIEKAGTVTIIR